MSRSRLVPLALAVTLLLAVVAVAARGRPLGSGGGGHGGLPGSFWDYLYTTIVIVVVPLLFTGLFAASLMRRKQGKGRGYWQSLLISLATWAAFIVLELLVVRHLKHLHLNLHQHAATETGNGVGRPGNPRTHHHGLNSTRALRFRWGELLIILGLLVIDRRSDHDVAHSPEARDVARKRARSPRRGARRVARRPAERS